MPLFMAVGVHSEQIVQIVKEMEMNAQSRAIFKVSLVPQLLTMLFAFLYISSERIITGPSPLSC